MKYYKKLSLEKLENQNEKNDDSDHIKLIICDRRNIINKQENQKIYSKTNTKIYTTLIAMTKKIENNCEKNFTKCKVNGRNSYCFWCTRSLSIEMRNQNITEFEIVDPDEFFGEDDTSEVQHQIEISSFITSAEQQKEATREEQDVYQNEVVDELPPDWEMIQSPVDLNQNYFSSEFENEIVASMSNQSFISSSTALNCDISADTNSCQILNITLCELICCRLRIVNGIPEKPLSPSTVFETISSSSTSRSSSLPPSLSPLSTCKIKRTINARKSPHLSITEEKRYRKLSKAEAYARSIMGAINKCQDCDSNSDSDDVIKIDQDNNNCLHYRNCDPFDIQEYFKLDDYGTILIDISHIIEEKGHGFLMRRTKKLYRSVKCGCEAINESYTIKKCMMERVNEFLKIVKDILFGHPRNKTQTGGPGESVRSYTLQLANDRTSTFSRNIENFISCTKESREAAPQVVMRNMRQFMNGMKNYLVKHGEGDFHQEVQKARSRLKSDEFLNLDAILEGVMHQLVVLPLREHLYGMFVDYYTRSGDIQLLVENVKYACGRNPIDFGIRSTVSPPTSMQLNQISSLLVRLQEAELPLEKLDLFLCVIAAVFEATGCQRGQQLGADDFLPILVFVVAKCGFVGAEIEAEFMWGLLQPALLSGEAGYYLTALCSAVHVLKSFMSSENEGTGSLDWRSSSLPACSSVLRVIIPDECNGSLQTRTLPVRPHTTTREVCRIIAHKARITNPQDYGLFKLVDGEETILVDSECPQDARIAARGKHCILAYKRIDAKIAWPTTTTTQSSSFA